LIAFLSNLVPLAKWISKLPALNSLLFVSHAALIFFSLNLTSCPGVELPSKNALSESVPHFSITSIGSIPLPRDLDIFLPFSSLTSPWMMAFLNGILPSSCTDWNIILETQNRMMSYPVNRVSERYSGLSERAITSSSLYAIGHRPDEYHVSSTSSSCTHPSPGDST
jgi:hypothetical protein